MPAPLPLPLPLSLQQIDLVILETIEYFYSVKRNKVYGQAITYVPNPFNSSKIPVIIQNLGGLGCDRSVVQTL